MKEDTSSSSTCGKRDEEARESTTHGLVRCGKVVDKVVEGLCKREVEEKLLIFTLDRPQNRHYTGTVERSTDDRS